MEEIKWDKQFSVDNEMIDAQHRKLIRILNRLINEHNSGYKNGEGEVILSELLNYAKTHFEEEESFLLKHDFPNFDEHKERHMAFSTKMSMFSLDFLQRKDGIENEMIAYLRKWVIDHLMNEDQEYKDFIAK